MVDDTYQEAKSYGTATVAVNMLNIAILISANLGVMNLLPLPALDGGRLVFLVIEVCGASASRRRRRAMSTLPDRAFDGADGGGHVQRHTEGFFLKSIACAAL